jgi:hypothetical protein
MSVSLGIDAGLHQILQILSLTQFEKTLILQAFQKLGYNSDLDDSDNS